MIVAIDESTVIVSGLAAFGGALAASVADFYIGRSREVRRLRAKSFDDLVPTLTARLEEDGAHEAKQYLEPVRRAAVQSSRKDRAAVRHLVGTYEDWAKAQKALDQLGQDARASVHSDFEAEGRDPGSHADERRQRIEQAKVDTGQDRMISERSSAFESYGIAADVYASWLERKLQ